jgi:hypothetical protein
MAKIVNLHAYRTKVVEKRTFGPWRKRFGESFSQITGLTDLSSQTLYFLAYPGEKNAVALYEFIMGALDFGTATKFYYLEKRNQMVVMEIHLFLADQIRFEMMRRLEWIDNFPSMRYTLLEMVKLFERIKALCNTYKPKLAKSHPDFASYSKLTSADQEVFIRRMLPEALDTYKVQIEL